MTRGYQHLNVARAPFAPYPRPTPPPPADPCGTCGGPMSRYNPHGHCYACLARNPATDAPTPTHRPRRHAPDCRCKALAARVNQRGRWRRQVPVTCPDCGAGRLSPVGGSHGAGPHCTRGYMTLCGPCARRRLGRVS